MATVYGTDNDDVGAPILGTQENDVIYGGSDDGSPLVGTGNDVLVGLEGNDELNGGDGDDILVGDFGPSGASGADNFSFSFALDEGSGGGDVPLAYADWLAAEHPSLDIDHLRQHQFSKTYTEWLKYLVDGWLAEAFDLDGGCDGTISVGMKQNKEGGFPRIEGMTRDEIDQVFQPGGLIEVITGHGQGHGHGHHGHGHGHGHGKWGNVTHDRYYSDIDPAFFDTGTGEASLSSTDGNDTILDFQKELDRIKFTVDVPDGFAGSDTELQALFTIEVGELSGVSDPALADTKLSLDSGGMSVIIADTTFVDDSVWDYVDFVYA